MKENKGVIILLALCAVVYVIYNNGGLNIGTIGDSDDRRATAAVVLGGGILEGEDNPSPSPGPGPSPNIKPYRKDCKECKGTGFITQGDGHVTECNNCIPDKEAKELINKFIEQEVNKLAGEKYFLNKKDKIQSIVDSILQDAADQYKKGNYEWAARYIGNAERILKKEKETYGDTGETFDKIKIAKDKLKAKGFEVVPVYVIEKDKYDKFIEDWKAYVEKHKNCIQPRAQEEYNSGDSCDLNGNCSGGSCGMGSCGGDGFGNTWMNFGGFGFGRRGACSSCGN